MAVSADKILTTTYDTVFGLLNAYVISVTDKLSNVITLNAWSTGKYWTGAYPNFDLDDADSYPCAFLHTATTSEGYVTYGADAYQVSIEAEVASTSGQQAALFAQEVIKEMKDYEKTILNVAGLKLKSVPTTTPHFNMRDKVRVHRIIVKFKFEVISVR